MIHLDDLHAFDLVMRLGGLGQSSRLLGVPKSTVSRRIDRLEHHLGQPLLRKQSNRLLPTEAGQLFHDYCQQALNAIEQGHRALDELSGEVSGQLIVAAHATLELGWLPNCLNEFMKLHPRLQLTLRSRNAPPMAADDPALSLWLGEVPDSPLRQETLGWLHCGLYASPEYLDRHGMPKRPEELIQHIWVDPPNETERGLLLTHPNRPPFLFHPPTRHSRLQVSQQMFMLHIKSIAHGHGLGVLPIWKVQNYQRRHSGSLVRCLPKWSPPSLPVTVLYAHGIQPRRIGALLALLRQRVPEEWKNPGPAQG